MSHPPGTISLETRHLAASGEGESNGPQQQRFRRRESRDINSVVVHLGVFYLGSILALSMLMATSAYSGSQSPFVTALGYRRAVARGDAHAVDFRLPGAPVTTWICTVSLVAVALYVMPDFSSANWYYTLVAGVLMLVGTNVGYEIGRRRLARNGLPDLGEGADD